MKTHGLFERDSRLSRMKVAAAIVGGSAIAGSVVKGISSSKAAKQQADAAQQAATGVQNEMNQNTQNQQPYMDAGKYAAGQLTSDFQNQTGFDKPFTLSDFMSNPGYQFQLQQGQNAIQGSAAAQGGALNGGTLKALSQYTTGLANTTYGDAYNRYLQNSNQQYNQLFGVAGLGENAAGTLGAQNTQGANNYGNFITQKGSAQAAGTLGVGNAITSGLGSIGGVLSAGSQSGYGGTPTNSNGGSSGYAGMSGPVAGGGLSPQLGISGPIQGGPQFPAQPPSYGQPGTPVPIQGIMPYLNAPRNGANPIYSAGY